MIEVIDYRLRVVSIEFDSKYLSEVVVFFSKRVGNFLNLNFLKPLKYFFVSVSTRHQK